MNVQLPLFTMHVISTDRHNPNDHTIYVCVTGWNGDKFVYTDTDANECQYLDGWLDSGEVYHGSEF